ncbi:MAG: KEOPS complex kinase/ATPase Bud32 [Candidatus Pacearchaeota archaeon]|jgi:Kae1-associated kinase Bud32
MKQKIIAQGAEAKIILEKNFIIKNRIKKSYRIPELDKKIRKRRTKKEFKLLKKASEIVNSPIPQEQKDFDKIKMPYLNGKKLSIYLDKFSINKQKQICKVIGREIAKLHNENIIHGDLTTSNMILKKDKIFFIDFGLGYFNGKIEDKAVDLHLLKQAMEAKHFKNYKILWQEVKAGYKNYKDSKKVFERLIRVEKRGRYKR